MSLLVPDTGLLFWMIISFGIVFFILAKYGFPVITKSVEKRNSYIENALASARLAEEKLATINQQAEVMVQEARNQRNDLLNEAQELKNRMVNDAKEAAEAESRLRLNKTSAEIEELRRRAMSGIREDVAAISVRIAEKILGEKLQDKEQQHKLMNRLIDEELIANTNG